MLGYPSSTAPVSREMVSRGLMPSGHFWAFRGRLRAGVCAGWGECGLGRLRAGVCAGWGGFQIERLAARRPFVSPVCVKDAEGLGRASGGDICSQAKGQIRRGLRAAPRSDTAGRLHRRAVRPTTSAGQGRGAAAARPLARARPRCPGPDRTCRHGRGHWPGRGSGSSARSGRRGRGRHRRCPGRHPPTSRPDRCRRRRARSASAAGNTGRGDAPKVRSSPAPPCRKGRSAWRQSPVRRRRP